MATYPTAYDEPLYYKREEVPVCDKECYYYDCCVKSGVKQKYIPKFNIKTGECVSHISTKTIVGNKYKLCGKCDSKAWCLLAFARLNDNTGKKVVENIIRIYAGREKA